MGESQGQVWKMSDESGQVEIAAAGKPKRYRKSTRPRPEGWVADSGVYLMSEVAKRLDWQSSHSIRQAKEKGLRTVRFGRQDFVFAKDLVAFLDKLGREQDDA